MLSRGVGRLLLPALIDACAAAGYRQMIGYIDAANQASLRLRESLVFRQVGAFPSIGYKFRPVAGLGDGAALAGAGRDGAAGGVTRFPLGQLARLRGRARGMRPTRGFFPFAGRRVRQAFPNPCQAFPNSWPFSANISKDSFGRFVRNQWLARRKRKCCLAPNFLRRSPCESPQRRRQGGYGGERYRKQHTTLFVFQKDKIALR